MSDTAKVQEIDFVQMYSEVDDTDRVPDEKARHRFYRELFGLWFGKVCART